jgi:predicted enzyme related to lactoylglutathione lyase
MSSTFIWYELLTSDTAAATAFYGPLLGWTARDSGQSARHYSILSRDDVALGGLMALPAGAEAMGMKPCWLGYVSVADVDRCVAEYVAAGGAVHMPAMDVPGIGRMAMVADPQGATLYVMAPQGAGPATAFASGKPGHGGWNELRAADWRAAFAFYQARFGWDKVHEMSMGPLGSYLQFNYGSGEMVGGMFNNPGDSRPHWNYCFNVADIDVAYQQVTRSGGTALSHPHQVPNGDWVFQVRDPQGAEFALVGHKA